jgi:hypothetical protein
MSQFRDALKEQVDGLGRVIQVHDAVSQLYPTTQLKNTYQRARPELLSANNAGKDLLENFDPTDPMTVLIIGTVAHKMLHGGAAALYLVAKETKDYYDWIHKGKIAEERKARAKQYIRVFWESKGMREDREPAKLEVKDKDDDSVISYVCSQFVKDHPSEKETLEILQSGYSDSHVPDPAEGSLLMEKVSKLANQLAMGEIELSASFVTLLNSLLSE